jgi:hypothetical protein
MGLIFQDSVLMFYPRPNVVPGIPLERSARDILAAKSSTTPCRHRPSISLELEFMNLAPKFGEPQTI